jgi:hypothetical protein
MNYVLVSVRVDAEVQRLKEKHGWTWRELINLGVEAKNGMPRLLGRLNRTEAEVVELRGKYNRLYQDFVVLRSMLDNIK